MTQPDKLGRYRVTGKLGAGAMGDVYAGVDDALGREVAIKVLKPQRNELAAAILDERFRTEARAIAALTHPNVVVVFDVGLDADPPFLVMERVTGESLKDRLASGALAEDEVRVLGIQIARALAAAHERRIVHRDVKPANILRADAHTWKLADFGVAHVPDSSLTMTGQFVGSPAYAPPEALVRGQSDREGDVFGLGATLYHAAAGAWPRLDATTSGLLAPVPPVRSLAPNLAPDLAAAIDAAVQVEPAARPNAHELAASLAGVARASSAAVTHASTPASAAAVRNAPSSPRTPGARASSPAIDAAPPRREGASQPLPAIATTAPGVPTGRTKPWIIGGAIALAVIILVGITRRGDGPSPRTVPASVTPTSPVATPPSELRAPPMPNGKAAKDWNKVVDHLERGNMHEAKKKLGEWERKHGATPETEALRAHLESLPDDGPPHERDDD